VTLLDSQGMTNNERGLLNAMRPAIESCVEAGRHVDLEPLTFRNALAYAYYMNAQGHPSNDGVWQRLSEPVREARARATGKSAAMPCGQAVAADVCEAGASGLNAILSATGIRLRSAQES
jgi:hypothetical protein